MTTTTKPGAVPGGVCPHISESPLAGGHFTNEPNTLVSLHGGKPPAKYSLIWVAPVKPPMAKLVLLALANYSDPDGDQFIISDGLKTTRWQVKRELRKHELALV